MLMGKWKKVFMKDESLRNYVERIYVRDDTDIIVGAIQKKRIKLCMILVVLLMAAIVYCWLQPAGESPLSDNQLRRQDNTSQMDLLVKGESEAAQWEREISITVGTRQFSPQERKTLSVKVKEYLQNRIKGNNTSLEMIKNSVFLPHGVPDTEIDVDWTVDENYVSADGKLEYENIPKTGADTELLAKASWKNWTEEYHFPIHLVGKEYSKQEMAVREVKKALEKAEKDQEDKATVVLPEKIGDVRLQYSMEGKERNFMLVYLILGTIVLLPVLWKQQQKKELEKREEQLLVDHPGMVNKFMLLLGAGLTVRKVVERLTGEYEKSRENGGEKRYIYEEICVMSQEMKDGVSEAEALEHFGKRCRLLPYLRFSSIMTQNLKKGAEGILQILEKESLEALEQRKERALQLGEKAGTKLLFPMILMLGIVMAIIMVPAFMTM